MSEEIIVLIKTGRQEKGGTQEQPVFMSWGDSRTMIDIGAMERRLQRRLKPDELEAVTILGEASLWQRTVEQQLHKYKDEGIKVSEGTMGILNQICGSVTPSNRSS
jgi:hypothetical protein